RWRFTVLTPAPSGYAPRPWAPSAASSSRATGSAPGSRRRWRARACRGFSPPRRSGSPSAVRARSRCRTTRSKASSRSSRACRRATEPRTSRGASPSGGGSALRRQRARAIDVSARDEPSAVQTAASVSRPHIIAIATLGSLVFGWLFTGDFFAVAALACGVDWFVVNLLNRIVDLREDEANAIVGTSFVVRHKRLLAWATVALLVVSVAITHVAVPTMTPLRLGYHALGAAYNWR